MVPLTSVSNSADHGVTVNGNCKSTNMTLEFKHNDSKNVELDFNITYDDTPVEITNVTLKFAECVIDAEVVSNQTNSTWMFANDQSFSFDLIGNLTSKSIVFNDENTQKMFPCENSYHAATTKFVLSFEFSASRPLPGLNIHFQNAHVDMHEDKEQRKCGILCYPSWMWWSLLSGGSSALHFLSSSVVLSSCCYRKKKDGDFSNIPRNEELDGELTSLRKNISDDEILFHKISPELINATTQSQSGLKLPNMLVKFAKEQNKKTECNWPEQTFGKADVEHLCRVVNSTNARRFLRERPIHNDDQEQALKDYVKTITKEENRQVDVVRMVIAEHK
ncbi:hypothetical protein M3Y96_00384900 [Aphelenchoides besseyi]|nr:hypothetical protein M3Y96_00384900 [Aphelenchoides besseyi]